MPLIQLIYVSAASHELNDSELQAILASSVRHNRDDVITGMLLYAQGSFMQVLEGDESKVLATYSRIHLDPRHRQVTLISLHPVEQREFAAWSMGFRRLTASDGLAHPELADYFRNGFDASRIQVCDGAAMLLLRQFSQGQKLPVA